jgi:hypothetical protein
MHTVIGQCALTSRFLTLIHLGEPRVRRSETTTTTTALYKTERKKRKKKDVSTVPKTPITLAHAYLAPRRIRRDRRHILDPSDPHPRTGERTQRTLSTGARGLRARAAGGPDLDMEGGDADLAAALGDVLGGQHGGVRGGLVAVGFDFHAA